MTPEFAALFFPPELEAGVYPRSPEADATDIERARALLAQVERSDLRLYVGPNASDFLPAFDAARGAGRGAIICWPAVFLGPAWLLYRTMFGLAAIVCSAPFIGAAMHIGQDALRYVGVLPLILGFFARPLYVAKARATIARLRSEGHPDAEAKRLISAAGGVSRGGAIIGALILFAPLLTGFVPAFVEVLVHGLLDSIVQGFNHALKAGH